MFVPPEVLAIFTIILCPFIVPAVILTILHSFKII